MCCGGIRRLIGAAAIVALHLLTGILGRALVVKDTASWLDHASNLPDWTPTKATAITLCVVYLVSSAASMALLMLLAKKSNLIHFIEKIIVTVASVGEIFLVMAAVIRAFGNSDVKAAAALMPLAAALCVVRVIVAIHLCKLSALAGLPALALIITGAIWTVQVSNIMNGGSPGDSVLASGGKSLAFLAMPVA